MDIILGGVTLPNFGAISEIITPNANENVTLDGSLYVDFINVRRGWRLEWESIKAADYDTIRAIFNAQFTTGTFPTLVIADESVNTTVYVKLNDRNIKYNGALVSGVVLELLEATAV